MRLAAPAGHDHLRVLDDVLVLSEERAHSLQGDVAQVYLAAIECLSVEETADRLALRSELRRSETAAAWVEDVLADLCAVGFLEPLDDDEAIESERCTGGAFARWELPRHLDRLLGDSAARAFDPSVAAGLAAHGVDALAASVAFRSGRPVPPPLRRGAWETALHALVSRRLIGSLHELLDQPMWLLKGAELAAHHPDPGLRRHGDVDLLVPDVDGAFELLCDHGWVPIGDPAAYRDKHQLAPLRAADWPIELDLHRRVSWPAWVHQPPTDELLARATPSATGLVGVGALAVEDQILHVAAHSFGHRPFWQLRDLVDLALLFDVADLAVVAHRARAWGMGRLWRATEAAVRSHVLDDGSITPVLFRALGRHVRDLDDSSLVRVFAEKSIGRFAVTDVRTALTTLRSDVAGQWADEDWATAMQALLPRLSAASRADIDRPGLPLDSVADAEALVEGAGVTPIHVARRTRKRADANVDPFH